MDVRLIKSCHLQFPFDYNARLSLHYDCTIQREALHNNHFPIRHKIIILQNEKFVLYARNRGVILRND
jgi:hypothetical protein